MLACYRKAFLSLHCDQILITNCITYCQKRGGLDFICFYCSVLHKGRRYFSVDSVGHILQPFVSKAHTSNTVIVGAVSRSLGTVMVLMVVWQSFWSMTEKKHLTGTRLTALLTLRDG